MEVFQENSNNFLTRSASGGGDYNLLTISPAEGKASHPPHKKEMSLVRHKTASDNEAPNLEFYRM